MWNASSLFPRPIKPSDCRPPLSVKTRSSFYCGDAQRVSEGFAIALRAMGVEGNVGLPTNNQNKEDN
jgi:hypothetical protein